MRCLSVVLLMNLLACGQSGEGPAVPEAIDAQGAGAADATPNGIGSENGGGDVRLGALPISLQTQVRSCEKNARFFDLGAQKCSSLTLAPFPCVINEELRALLDPTTLDPLDTYLQTKAVDLTLYACTVDETNISLHFYKFETGIVQYRKLNVAKKQLN